ncbi:hypothetical protein [Roseateles noduli]|uniref:hypothetical protein n=1 Tax=Roseateles noduli TaxID=2052484 RepID=UPI003D65D94F
MKHTVRKAQTSTSAPSQAAASKVSASGAASQAIAATPRAVAQRSLIRQLFGDPSRSGDRVDAGRPALSTRPPASAWVAQLEHFPADRTDGTLDTLHATIPKGDNGETEDISGTELQKRILALAGGMGTAGGYRLGSFLYGRDKTLTRKTDDHAEEALEMTRIPTSERGKIDPLLVPFVRATVGHNGQLAYVDHNAEQIFAHHYVVIDVDCQFDRRGNVGFHKDSRGTTVFFNLSYSNAAPIQGPDHYEDIKGDAGMERDLPGETQRDIQARRLAQQDVPLSIKSPTLEANALIGLSDPNNWHSTPVLNHRRPSTMSREDMLKIVAPRVPKDTDLGALSDATLAAYVMGCYHTHNLEAAATSSSQDKQALVDQAPKLKRRLSTALDSGDIAQSDLDKEAKAPRSFIRTWVRFVPKPK